MIEEHPAQKFRAAKVDKIEDRGEKFDGEGRLMFEEFESLTGNTKELCEQIQNEFDEGFAQSNVSHTLGGRERYMPRTKLRDIITPTRVRMIVGGLSGFEHISDKEKDKLTRDICFGQNPCWKLLAILIDIGREEDFPAHRRDGVCDLCLPMTLDKSGNDYKLSCSLHGQHNSIKEYRPRQRYQFSQRCHEFMAPYIVCRKEQHSHYILRTDDVFPMVAGPANEKKGMSKEPQGTLETESSKMAGSYGGFSQVYQVRIDKSHYDFGDLGMPHPEGLFAMKKLNSHSRDAFNLELQSLLFSIHNTYNEKSKDHIIRVLATFEMEESSVNTTNYYLLFDWAEGNLGRFWDKNEKLIGDKSHGKWMSEKFYEICLALQCVHNERDALANRHRDILQQSLRGTDRDISDLYGRHGDIKPDNILWFLKSSQNGKDLGSLVLADFGLGKLHTQVTRSLSKPNQVPMTATYRAPEFDLPNGLISRASDIFSLGCVFLEYITWFLLGSDAVNKFSDFRETRDIYEFDSDTFFTIETGSTQPVLKTRVKDWIQKLQANENCSCYLDQLLEIIQDGMLEPVREKRIKIVPLIREMEKLKLSCERCDSFYLERKETE
ncbi:kinase-like protein [Biscogniauxia mediterranea]|nr:kinase-like protein [Biscogniauxia mediterranea]